MKILFFGLGSIGLRHAKIIQEKYNHKIFAYRSDKNKIGNDLGIAEIYSWSEVRKSSPDICFITNPTSLHIKTAIKCATLGSSLFIEKPIDKTTKGLDELLSIVKKKGLVTYVSYNLRFHPVIKDLKKLINKEKPLYIRAVNTSYLPNWRPGTDHLKSYSSSTKMGGGVILDLSHEIDYVSYLLGGVKALSGSFGRASYVTVDAEDYADVLVSSNIAPASVHIDFMSHVRKRYVQVDFKNLSVIGDLINSKITYFKTGKMVKTKIFDYEISQTYYDQLAYFFKNIKNPKMMNNLKEASALFNDIVKFKSL